MEFKRSVGALQSSDAKLNKKIPFFFFFSHQLHLGDGVRLGSDVSLCLVVFESDVQDEHLTAPLRGQGSRRAQWPLPPSQTTTSSSIQKMHLPSPPMLFNEKAGLRSTRVSLCGPRARLAYFAFYLTLCRGRTHQWPSRELHVLPSREWQLAPGGSPLAL